MNNTSKYVYAFAWADYDSIAAALVDIYWETFYLYNYKCSMVKI